MRGFPRDWNSLLAGALVRLRVGACLVAGLALMQPGRVAYGQAPANGTKLLLPSGTAYDAAGNLFFADTGRNQVLEVSLSGALTVVAGSGDQGFGGDGGSATAALFNAPTAIAVGPDGTVYVADTGNQRIRVIAGGVVRTFAGTGARGVAKEGSAAVAAPLRDPGEMSLAADGSLLLCDAGNHRVLRVSNGVVSTVAGSGTQGFVGDGGPAVQAELDTPSGVAAMPDGRIVIADTHNHRLRVVGTDGVIRTLAGTGAPGFAGDGGQAVSARLFLPRGVSATAAGDVIFADSNNHRLRSVSSSGSITTVAGDGVQGAGDDAGSAPKVSLDTPRGAAVSRFGAGIFAEAHNHFIREVAVDGKLYVVAAPAAGRVSSVALQMPSSLTYGDGAAVITVTSSGPPAQGTVGLVEGTVTLGSADLTGGGTSVSMAGLPAGTHSLSAKYAGDGINPAGSSSAATVTVAARPVIATADDASVTYGSAVPQLTGTVRGILPQDTAGVAANFAADLSAAGSAPASVGTYPILASLSGKGSVNYTVGLAKSSGSLTVTQAHSTVTMQSPAQTYAGLPLVLSAALGSATAGVPTGEVAFLDGSTVVAKGNAANGYVTATFLAPSAGTHQLTASYSGDGNFFSSASTPLAVSVAAMPDFAVTAQAAGVSVQAGRIASYVLSVVPSGGAFTGSVNFSVATLPAGAKASFSPAVVVPGASGTTVTLSIETPATLAGQHPLGPGDATPWFALTMCAFVVAWRRKRLPQAMPVFFAVAVLLASSGCGDRTVATASAVVKSFPLVVTATSTNLAGQVVSHTVSLVLSVQ